MLLINEDTELSQEVTQLEQEHLELNQVIDDPLNREKFDPLTFQRLKKRKLFLKDRINELKSSLYPNIIA